MARTLTLPKKGTGQWTEGWHTVNISKAEYGMWNESKYIDLWFEGYPDNFNMRVYIPFAQQTSLNVDVEDGSSNENDFVVINGQAYDNETEELIGKGCALGCDVGDDSLIHCSTVDTGECQSVIKPVETKEYLYTTGFNNDVDMCHYTFVGDTAQRVAPC